MGPCRRHGFYNIVSRQKCLAGLHNLDYDLSKDVGIESMQPVVHFNNEMMEDLALINQTTQQQQQKQREEEELIIRRSKSPARKKKGKGKKKIEEEKDSSLNSSKP